MALPHHNLVVWQRADDLFIDIHRLTHQRFPAHERYELGAQLRRAAFSVPANVVEGIARPHERDAIRFFDIASSSLSETSYGLHAATRLGYLDQAEYEKFELRLKQVSAPLQGLIRRYRSRGSLIRGATTVAFVLVFIATLL